MSHTERTLETYDTLSSGDSNHVAMKQHTKEVNNNEVDELSKELSEMGCIVDAVKRPPNICVETCVYESDSEKSEANEDAYSDEFEDDKSEDERESVEVKTVTEERLASQSVKLSQSQSTVSSKPPMSVSGRSGRSYGSISVPQTRRINMSFTNDRLREIERHNHILLTKIMSARNAKSSIPPREAKKPLPSAAVCRRKQQRQIDHDNMILLKKIQRAKSSALSIRR